jgi:hypothetical protein
MKARSRRFGIEVLAKGLRPGYAATDKEAVIFDIETLVGDIRRLGLAGPPYEVVGPASPLPTGEAQMCIHLFETNETFEYAVADILSDPKDNL